VKAWLWWPSRHFKRAQPFRLNTEITNRKATKHFTKHWLQHLGSTPAGVRNKVIFIKKYHKLKSTVKYLKHLSWTNYWNFMSENKVLSTFHACSCGERNSNLISFDMRARDLDEPIILYTILYCDVSYPLWQIHVEARNTIITSQTSLYYKDMQPRQ